MHLHESFLTIIPAREGSKGLPGKNLKKIGKKPMIQFTIEAALLCIHPKNILVTSDDDEVINLSARLGLEVPFKRPKKLSTDYAKTSDVVQHALDWYQSEYNKLPANIILLQPTSPFRNSNDINSAIKKFIQSGKESLI
jgi:CMP-N-acetylneuraminic acid synthetase